MGGDCLLQRPGLVSLSFNPRPRVGGDVVRPVDSLQQDVSIHAPVWGATFLSVRIWSISACFNPRPRVGGDATLFGSPVAHTCFNPRPRVGGDVLGAGGDAAIGGFNPRPRVGGDVGNRQHALDVVVSIHAPVWGATVFPLGNINIKKFQSTPPCGGRPHYPHGGPAGAKFQSTPPCGGRRPGPAEGLPGR